MRIKGLGKLGLIGLFAATLNATPQTPGVDGGAGVVLKAIVHQSRTASDESATIQLTIYNRTDEIVEIPTYTDTTPFKIIVHDQNGQVPYETIVGCKLHQSEACGPAGHSSSLGKSTPLFVAVGKARKFQIDVSREYTLNPGTVYTVSIEVNQASLIKPPPAGSPIAALFESPRKSLGPLGSDSVTIEIVR